MFVVDTNILVYAANQDSPVHTSCAERLEAWRVQAEAWFVTWGILCEFLRVTTHPRVLKKPWSATTAWSFVECLLESPGLQVLSPTERHANVMARLIGEMPDLRGNIFHDAHTAALMREHGVLTIYTRDTHFHRFRFLHAVDPTGFTLHESSRRTVAARQRIKSRKR